MDIVKEYILQVVVKGKMHGRATQKQTNKKHKQHKKRNGEQQKPTGIGW